VKELDGRQGILGGRAMTPSPSTERIPRQRGQKRRERRLNYLRPRNKEKVPANETAGG